MGGHPLHWGSPGGVPGPGGAAADREAPVKENRQEVGLHLGGNGKGGSRVPDNVGVHSVKSEHSRSVHR